MQYNISTKVEDGVIMQTVKSDQETTVHSFIKTVMDTREQAIRQALISLGWTPPTDD